MTKLDYLPEGYSIYSTSNDKKTIIVCYDGRWMFKTCAPYIIQNGWKYNWGPMAIHDVPQDSSFFGGYREYILCEEDLKYMENENGH
jgi:hypothetical protein